ncbi:hypothetical protein XBP1_2420031 [Xenorhabdus bovienii str. puntauvense]|uniref:Transposase n=2 Tax=Xenorhabdus bovienii TaxID=40576 RepID=A0A077NDM2_XENBV|nr:hypothetical protein XBP1_2420031 [Xenorhabdus bovienii str. puntauvense]CDH01191.1 hypothetical protein XBFM1_2040019 [Xenorhabdus bovienii str. feltiae Moldova]
MCQNGSVLKQPFNNGSVHYEDDNSGYRSGKNVFQIHGVDAQSETVLKKQLPRARDWSNRTAQANAIRGLLSEFGIVIVQGVRLPEILESVSNSLPDIFRQLFQQLGEHLKELDRQVIEPEQKIQHWHR